jgi:hypothetical protein
MKKFINLVLIVLLLAMGTLLTISAETGNSDKKTSGAIDIELSKEEIPKLVEIIWIWKLVDELGLNEEQLVQFIPRMKELNNLKSDYYRNRRTSISRLKKLMDTDPAEEQLKLAVDEFRNADIEFHQKEREMVDMLNSILTTKQQAEFVTFQEDYRRDMHRLLKNLRELSNLREREREQQPLTLKENK